MLKILLSYVVFCHRPFLLCTSPEPMVIPLLRLQVPDCSTFCIVCDVPSIAVFCSESVECFLGMASKYVLKTFLYCSSVSIYYPCIHTFHVPHSLYSIHILLYFSFFSASFCMTFLSSGIAASISVPCFLFFVYNYNIWPICCNFSVFTA